MEESPYPFDPVPTRARADGWTPERQRRFIAQLARTGIVAVAAREVGMGQTSAYNLRRRKGAESFAAAWDDALDEGRLRAFDVAMSAALHGTMKPRFYRGRFTGTVVHDYDTSLTLAALRGPPVATGARRTGRK